MGCGKRGDGEPRLRSDFAPAASGRPQDLIEVRFVEVKGRAGVGDIALTDNEYRTAVRLKDDYWLYAVFNCAGTPQLHAIQNPARLGWQPVVTVEHFRIAPQSLLEATRK